MKTKLVILLSVILAIDARAGSATWNLNPTTGAWSNAANWTPATVPDGPSDTATFGVSNTTAISASDQEVKGIVFDPGASAFTITCENGADFIISGTGVTNNSGVVQNFAANPRPATSGTNYLKFFNSANAGSNTQYTAVGADTQVNYGGVIEFLDTSSAGSAVFIVKSGKAHNDNPPGVLVFSDASTAGDATITNNGGPSGGVVSFQGTSTAGNAFIMTNGARHSDDQGGVTSIANGGNATIVANGGAAPGAPGGLTTLLSSGDAATFIANGGTNGGAGGEIFLFFQPTAASARFEVFGNGFLDLQSHLASEPIGSIEGDGLVLIAGSEPVQVGSNSLDTTFSGVIRIGDGFIGGAIAKVGSGTLTLTGANTYPDGTTVSEGSLIVSNTTGSGTGNGPVQVNGGTLGGHGTIPGAITVGTGSGPGAFLAPAAGSKVPATLTTSSVLTLNADATYNCRARAKTGRVQSDRVVANGVTINGATFSFDIQVTGTLTAGTVFTVINNTTASPINGIFGNLADGAIIMASGNNFQADYQGGDGNDLTLTVVP
jgi:autotransporter-associated beta strand protein